MNSNFGYHLRVAFAFQEKTLLAQLLDQENEGDATFLDVLLSQLWYLTISHVLPYCPISISDSSLLQPDT